MERREFSRKVKLAAWQRAGGKCEQCTRALRPGDIRYDHVLPCFWGGEASLQNCQVICRACDAPKTRSDQKAIAKGKRVRAKHLGIHKRKHHWPSRPFPKRRFD
jgi:5-methylcytosine-specific restriction endonuclease McrA